MSTSSARLAEALATMANARRTRRRRRSALLQDRVLQGLVADLVAARSAARMTQLDVALRMGTTKSAISRLESGRFARPTLETIESYAQAVNARLEIRITSRWR